MPVPAGAEFSNTIYEYDKANNRTAKEVTTPNGTEGYIFRYGQLGIGVNLALQDPDSQWIY